MGGECLRVLNNPFGLGNLREAVADDKYENSTEQFNPLDKLTESAAAKAYTTGMERSAHAAVAAGVTA